MYKFPCTKCGCCCKRVGNLNKFIFPYDIIDGKCEKLINNTCSIYEDRPLICRIDELVYASGMGRDLWYMINADSCNKMMCDDNIPVDLRVKL